MLQLLLSGRTSNQMTNTDGDISKPAPLEQPPPPSPPGLFVSLILARASMKALHLSIDEWFGNTEGIDNVSEDGSQTFGQGVCYPPEPTIRSFTSRAYMVYCKVGRAQPLMR